MTITSPVSPRPVDGKVIPDELDLLGALTKVKQDEPAFGVSRISKELETRYPVSLHLLFRLQLHSPGGFACNLVNPSASRLITVLAMYQQRAPFLRTSPLT
jgi:hypothetical protein